MIPFPFQAGGLGLVQQAAGAVDPHWSSVLMLMNEGASNGATSFTDAKGNSYSRTGSAVVATGIGGFPGACVNAPANGSYFSIAASTGLNFLQAGDYTIEAKIRLTNAAGTGNGSIIIGRANSVGSNGWIFRCVNSGLELAYPGLASANLAQTWTLNQTYDVMACRIGTQHYLGINGVVSAVSLSNRVVDAGSDPVYIGDHPNYADSIEYVSHRVTRGVGRYNANYTPPTSWPTS